MSKIELEKDQLCEGDPWGETTCDGFDHNTNICKDTNWCLDCKIKRIQEILNSIKIKD